MLHFRPQRYVFLLKKRLVSRKNSDRHCDVFDGSSCCSCGPHDGPTCSIPACCRDSMRGCRVCYDLGGGLLEGVLAQALAADGEVLHVVRNGLAQILVRIEFCKVLAEHEAVTAQPGQQARVQELLEGSYLARMMSMSELMSAMLTSLSPFTSARALVSPVRMVSITALMSAMLTSPSLFTSPLRLASTSPKHM